MVTGRPGGLQPQDSSGPIPQTGAVGSSNGGPDVYYSALMKLSMIGTAVQGELYSARTMQIRKTRDSAEKVIGGLAQKTDLWKQGLPESLAFDQDFHRGPFVRQVSCNFFIHSHHIPQTLILPANRPWLPISQRYHTCPFPMPDVVNSERYEQCIRAQWSGSLHHLSAQDHRHHHDIL